MAGCNRGRAIRRRCAFSGAHNHRGLIRQMAAAPSDPHVIERFRVVASAEAIALASVIAATAVLVGAAS